jgi:hypothetical protein
MSTLPSHPPERPAVPAPPPAAETARTDGLDTPPLAPLGSDPYVRTSPPPPILEAQQTFLRDLPELLTERRQQWVAYHGGSRIGFGATKTALWQECLRQGYQEFLVRRTRPRAESDLIATL